MIACCMTDLSLAWLLVVCVCGTRLYPLISESLVLVDYSLLVSWIVWESLPTVCLRPSLDHPTWFFHTLTTTTIWTYHTTGLHSLIFTTTPSSVSPIGRGLCLTWSEWDYATFCCGPCTDCRWYSGPYWEDWVKDEVIACHRWSHELG